MYDIHPDLLVAFERVRQEHLQHQTEMQRLLRHAPLYPPSQRGRWSPPVGACLRSLGRKLRTLVQPSARQPPVVLVPPPGRRQEEEHDRGVSMLRRARELEQTTV
jgi:hypothetical protein